MRNSESTHLFTHKYFWKLVSISIISAVSIPPSLSYNPDKQTNKQTQQLGFNNIDFYRFFLTWVILTYWYILTICGGINSNFTRISIGIF